MYVIIRLYHRCIIVCMVNCYFKTVSTYQYVVSCRPFIIISGILQYNNYNKNNKKLYV